MSKAVSFSRPAGYAELTPPVLRNIFDFAGTPEDVSQMEVAEIQACRNVCKRWRVALAQSWQTYQNICLGRFEITRFSLPNPKGQDYFFPRGRQDVYLSWNDESHKLSVWDLNTRLLLGEVECESPGDLNDFNYSRPYRRPWVHGNFLIFVKFGDEGVNQLVVYDFVLGKVRTVHQDPLSSWDRIPFTVIGNKLVYRVGEGEYDKRWTLQVFNLATLKTEGSRKVDVSALIDIGWEEMNGDLLITNWENFSIYLHTLDEERSGASAVQDYSVCRVPVGESGEEQHWVPIQAVHVKERCALIARRDFISGDHHHAEICREFDRRLVQFPAHGREKNLRRFGYYAAPNHGLKFARLGERVMALGPNVRVYDFSMPAKPIKNAFWARSSNNTFLPQLEYQVPNFPQQEVQLYKGKMVGIDIKNRELVVCDFTAKAPDAPPLPPAPPAENLPWYTCILNALCDLGRCLVDYLCSLFSNSNDEER